MPPRATIGVMIPNAFIAGAPGKQEFQSFFQAADSLGMGYLWANERILHPQAQSAHPFTMLAWAAGLTSRVKLGTAVVLATLRHPLLIAQAAATLHYVSGGRFAMGISLGGRPEEFQALGASVRQRPGRLEETIALLRQTWSGPRVSFRGRYYTFDGPSPGPRPSGPGDIPILLGGSADPTLRRVGTMADGWIAGSSTTAAQFRESWQKVEHYAREAGRDPRKLVAAKLVYMAVDDTVEKARKRIADYTMAYYGPQYDVDARCAFGPPAACAAKLQTLVDAGVRSLILGLVWPSVREVERIQKEVVPLLR